MCTTGCATGSKTYQSSAKAAEQKERKRSGSSTLTLLLKEKSAELWNKGKTALRRNTQTEKPGTRSWCPERPYPEDRLVVAAFASERTMTSEIGSEDSSTPWSLYKSGSGPYGRASSLDSRLLPPLPNPNSGAAAKASVAAQIRKGHCSPRPRLPRTETPWCEPMRLLTSAKLGQSLTKDTESGVDLHQDNGVSEEFNTPVIRMDPFEILPPEITSAILSYLDARSLAHTESVSSKWRNTASERHAWRETFWNVTRSRMQLPVFLNDPSWSLGLGLGGSSPDQDWKAMLKARTELHARWRDMEAAAIYLEGHTDSVYCVQFDEHKIVTGSRDQTVRVWDAKTYQCTKLLGVPNRNSVNSRPPLPVETFEQEGRPTAVFAFDASNMEPRHLPVGFRHTGSILCLQYDENLMVTGSSDKTCIMWDLTADYTPFRRLRCHEAGVLDICFDEKHLVSCSKDTSICLWDRRTGERLRRLMGHRGPVNAVQLRGNLIVSASGDGVAKLWNLTSGLCIKEFPSKDRGMACVDFSLDARTVLAGGNDQIVYKFDTTSGELIREMTGHAGLVRSLYLDNANDRIISGSYDTSVRAYDLATGELIVALVAWTTSWILSAKADYRRIVAASQDSRVVIIDFGHKVPGIELLAS